MKIRGKDTYIAAVVLGIIILIIMPLPSIFMDVFLIINMVSDFFDTVKTLFQF